MSIAELDSMYAGGPAEDRLPPQDVHAEMSVLGSMLLNKDAIADVIEVVKAADFYRPAHELVYDAILDLFGRGEPADAITVADELGKRGDLTKVGGAAYLHQLIQTVPTAANAEFYAEIVHERAVLRRLVEAGTRIVQMGYGQGEGGVDEIVNRAQAEVYAVAEKRGGEDYHVLGELLEPTMAEIEAAAGRGGELIGVPTGFTDLDELTHGLHPGQMIVVAARPAVGKALALDTPLPTPTGWTTMGEVVVGDQLLDAHGRPTTVVAATEVMEGRPCFEVEFSDGSVLIADAEHQWLTDTRASRKSFQAARDGRNRMRNQGTFAQVRTTEEIARTLRLDTTDQRLNHSVRLTAPLQLPRQDYLISPYVLGAWLGDGTSAGAAITTADDEMVMFLEAEGLVVRPTAGRMRYSLTLPTQQVTVRRCVVCGVSFVPRTSQVKACGRSCGGRSRGTTPMPSPTCPDCGKPSTGLRQCQECRNDHGTFKALLRKIGVLDNKHIPVDYLRGSEEQRRDLLAGLLDTDGTVASSGTVQFTTTSARLCANVEELVVGLGYRVGVSRKTVRGRTVNSSVAHILTFSADDDVFRLSRKAVLHKERRLRRFHRRDSRFISDVRPISSVPVRCVEVDNGEHLYLAGRSMIPTHNSTLGIDIARHAAIKNLQATAVFSLEMSRSEITTRILSAEASIQLQDLRRGLKSQEAWTKLARVVGNISNAPLFIDDSPNMSLMEIRAKCRRLSQQHNLKLVIIDYLQLMTSGKKVESRQQEVAEFSRALKLLAKELEVPVIAISQLNRGPEQRTDKRPQMSDLRESGCLPASTRILRADTGAETTIGELYAAGARDITVWSLDDGLRYRKRTMTHVFCTGIRPVFRVRTSSGKEVSATGNHPFLTPGGWRALEDLGAGSLVAVPRHVPSPAYLTSDWTDADLAAEARTLAASGPGGRVPEAVFALPKEQIARFLNEVWEVMGQVDVYDDAGPIMAWHDSRLVLEGLGRLLLRFGIQTLHKNHHCGGDPLLFVDGVDSMRRFLQEIGAPRKSLEAGEDLLEWVRGVSSDAGSVDSAVWSELETTLSVHGEGAEAGGVALLERVAATLDAGELDLAATNDVAWEQIVSIVDEGVEKVYDATVLDSHNFIADGIAVHNSIEQDADVVILLHRDRSDPDREGEADVIVAKHRNGPTKDLVLGFQGHYSRFANMAKDGGF